MITPQASPGPGLVSGASGHGEGSASRAFKALRGQPQIVRFCELLICFGFGVRMKLRSAECWGSGVETSAQPLEEARKSQVRSPFPEEKFKDKIWKAPKRILPSYGCR